MNNQPEFERTTMFQFFVELVKTRWYKWSLVVSDEYFVRAQYFRYLGKKLDLKNPQTFNEKIQWNKINDRNDLITQSADKFEARKYVEKRIGTEYLVDLYWYGTSPYEIPYEDLPTSFVVKTNHASQNTVIVWNKSEVNERQLANRLSKWMNRNYFQSGRQWAYKNIQPKLLIEKLLRGENGSVPDDYKFFVFAGKVKAIQVDTGRFSDHLRDLYSPSWEKLPVKYVCDNLPIPVGKPENLQKMIELAESLGSDFRFARIDFYLINNQIYFGEITHYPEGGYGKFVPVEYDKIFGQYMCAG